MGDSPRALATGIIKWQLDWQALMDEKKQSKKEATAEIERIFQTITLHRLFQAAPEPKSQ